jgi:uncharacterized protein YndB with AHSA1/START domain
MGTTRITADPGTPFIDIEREFDAPPELVYRAWTEPDLLVQWLGPNRMTMEVEAYDVRDGGRWRYIHRDPDGTAHGFHGVFHGTPSLEGIVQTFEYEGAPGDISLDTLRFESRGGRTLTRSHSVYQSVAARDAMVASGMERGLSEGFARLDELLVGLQAPVV